MIRRTKAVHIFRLNCLMKFKRVLIFSVLLLDACRTSPPAPGAPLLAEPPVAESALATSQENCRCNSNPNDVDDLLSYQRAVRQMNATEQSKAMAHLNRQPATARVLMQKAMLFANLRGNGDLARAQSLLEQVLTSTKSDAERLKPLANLLNISYGEWRRLDDNTDRLTQQLREEQHRVEQLNNKLEALKNIENTMQTRPRSIDGSSGDPK